MMAKDTLIEEIHEDRKHVRRTFKEIREALEKAISREDLTELYKQSVYMILMTHSSPLNEKDREMKRRRETTEKEFGRTVRMINRQAKKIGVEPDFNEDWEKIATNGYETEDKNLLEAQQTVGIVRE
jgi:sugar-specific transcriptional regulator TrmB